ncbi:General secretion pathway protein F [Olavius algarvensis associated proteobacterium Delta 3]|nr:General secretion pathway protein F [Olavius algarvensis associated proteobacterium Delta 3]CAB5154338.1 General secretion pathway protein F [Olavius algarvensis associated proteobacterium Delta 3]
MPVYEYTALDIRGKNVKGIIDADSAVTARSKLRGSRIYPVSLNKVTDQARQKESGTPSLSQAFTRVRAADIAMMTRQLATLLSAGFPLVGAIDTLLVQTKSHAFKKILARIKDALVEGSSFAEALALYPSVYSSLYVNMVRAGETSGTLEIILERLAEIEERQLALSSRIRAALAYPILMAFVGAAVLLLLLTFIVPNITSIFQEMNQALPAPTRILIAVSNFFKSYWWLTIGILTAGFVAFRMAKRTRRGQYGIDRIKLNMPGGEGITKKLAAARFARTLGSLLENGVTMMPSLAIVKNIVGNLVIADAVEFATAEVEKGKPLGDSLSGFDVFPPLSVQMIQVGEQSGELEKMLIKIADVYENEVESKVLQMTQLIEPVMILVMAVIVGFIVISICLPIFEMNQLIT